LIQRNNGCGQQGSNMSNEIVTGTVKPVEPRREKRGYCYFDQVAIEQADGKQRLLNKVSVGGEVAKAVRRGGKGRFYVSTYGGQTGIHGVRLDDGTEAYAKYNNIETMLLFGVAAGAFMLVIGLAGIDGFMITPVLIGAALLVLYIYLRSQRIAAKRHYDEAR
jgi:hypothetical protein